MWGRARVFSVGLFSPKVGPKGRIYAIDIAKGFVEHIERTCKQQGIKNVTGVVCKQDDVNLPPNSIDLAFICDTYHHFEFPYKTMRSIHRALRPNGQVIMIDFHRIKGGEFRLGVQSCQSRSGDVQEGDHGLRVSAGRRKETAERQLLLAVPESRGEAKHEAPGRTSCSSYRRTMDRNLAATAIENVQTPNLDGLAAEGIRFQHAFVTHPVCSCSQQQAILTGLYPHQNGQIGLATHKYAMFRHFPNIPSVLKQHGYRTGIIGKLHVNPESAFPFDFRWNDRKYISFSHRDVRRIAEETEGFITASDTPFFLMVNYPDAHFPLLRQQNGIPQAAVDGE